MAFAAGDILVAGVTNLIALFLIFSRVLE